MNDSDITCCKVCENTFFNCTGFVCPKCDADNAPADAGEPAKASEGGE